MFLSVFGLGVVLASSYFQALLDAPGSTCIFPAQVLESDISPRSLVTFNDIRDHDSDAQFIYFLFSIFPFICHFKTQSSFLGL